MPQNIGKHRNEEELYKCRSSHSRCSIRKAVLKDNLLFSRKHLCISLFLIKRLQHKCFPGNIANFFYRAHSVAAFDKCKTIESKKKNVFTGYILRGNQR